MSTIYKKLIIYLSADTADLAEWLDAQSKRTGVSVTELGRRALQAFRYTVEGATTLSLGTDGHANVEALLRHSECTKQLERVGIKVLVAETKQ